jgi:hypothetical protein
VAADKSKDRSATIPADRVIQLLAWALLGGGGVTVLYALQAQGVGRVLAVLGVALTVAGAATIVGALVGFVFGIPRALQGTDGGAAAPVTGQGSGGGAQGAKSREQAYRANTSLEQISDWLTKILVGVGLTQLTQLPAAIESYSSHLGAALGDLPGASVFIGAASLYFMVNGFLLSYLWTRLTLGKAFSEADVVTREELQEARDRNARALALVEQQLQKGAPVPPESELESAIAAADDLYRSHIYERAKTVRSENRGGKDPELVARTIPIFRALIKRSPEAFHQSYGQLGIALFDKVPPSLDECEENLSRAIRMRGEPWEQYGYGVYELVRARCRIKKAATLPESQRKADPALRSAILSDLRVARHWPFEQLEPQTKEEILQWLKANHLKLDDLG